MGKTPWAVSAPRGSFFAPTAWYYWINMSILDNTYVSLDLQFRQGEPFEQSVDVNGVNWEGSYASQIYDPSLTTVANVTVSSTFADDVTTFIFSINKATSSTLPAGNYRWACRATTGEVRIRGSVKVEREPVPIG